MARREELIARAKQYQRDNREKVNEKNRAWRAANKTKADAYRQKWKTNNPEQWKETKTNWEKANTEARRRHCHNRRARILASGGRLSRDITAKLLALQKGKCPYCSTALRKYHIDHIVPLARGGVNADSNVQLLCQKCNQEKGAKDPIAFMQQKGFLL